MRPPTAGKPDDPTTSFPTSPFPLLTTALLTVIITTTVLSHSPHATSQSYCAVNCARFVIQPLPGYPDTKSIVLVLVCASTSEHLPRSFQSLRHAIATIFESPRTSPAWSALRRLRAASTHLLRRSSVPNTILMSHIHLAVQAESRNTINNNHHVCHDQSARLHPPA